MPEFLLTTKTDEDAIAHAVDEIRKLKRAYAPHIFDESGGDAIDRIPLNIYVYNSDQLIGVLTGATIWGGLSINWIWVDTKWRRQGIAREMMSRAITEAKNRGATYAVGNTWETLNAYNIFEKLGAKLQWRQVYDPGKGPFLRWYRLEFKEMKK